MHVTSLPSRFGVGELGRPVLSWLDEMAEMQQVVWQVLPLGPTGYGDSPYQSPSAFAGNPLLIGLEILCEEGWLHRAELEPLESLSKALVDYEKLIPIKSALLQTATQRFLTTPPGHEARKDFHSFCVDESSWLENYALFAALKDRECLRPWWEWPAEFRDFTDKNVESARKLVTDVVEEKKVQQFFFYRQWTAMCQAAADRNITILGDMPIFVAHDSAEVWSGRQMFHLDPDGQPTVIAGVPPDYFSATGQRWGNPLYNWTLHKQDDFAWWTSRLRRALALHDSIRIDHFRGFVDYWEIPASETSALNGRWMPSPGKALFETVEKNLGEQLPIIAEDLGVLSQEVASLREEFGFPGMRILQFAFGTDPLAHTFLPEAYVQNCVAYTGTHDNDTVVGWFHDEGSSSLRSSDQCERERRYCMSHLGVAGKEIHWEMIEVLMQSRAGLVMFPLQDIMGLGSDGRMNVPGTTTGNWRWRLESGQLNSATKQRLATATRKVGRNRNLKGVLSL